MDCLSNSLLKPIIPLMAAVLSNMSDIKQVSFFMEECKRMGLEVLGPDVNESHYKFTVNDNYGSFWDGSDQRSRSRGQLLKNRKDGTSQF
jgi:DNA polymerase-3 subunit alpha